MKNSTPTIVPVEDQKPVLVYGTLRPGCGNYEVFLQGHTCKEEVIKVAGLGMYGVGGFPYVRAEEEGVITATLVTLKPGHYSHVMQSLDFLEGYRGVGKSNHYERKLAVIRNSAGERVEAWVYVVEGVNAERLPIQFVPTPGGDWAEHMAARVALRTQTRNGVGSSFLEV